MRVLIAEDAAVCRVLLRESLAGWGYEVVVTVDGDRAWQELQKPDAPPLAHEGGVFRRFTDGFRYDSED